MIRATLLLVLFATVAYGQSSFQSDTKKWRSEHEAEISAEDGWLTVAGLFWLKDGVTRIGTDPKQVDIALPPNSAPAKVGTLELVAGIVTLKVDEGVLVTVKDKPIREYVMKFDSEKPPDQFRLVH